MCFTIVYLQGEPQSKPESTILVRLASSSGMSLKFLSSILKSYTLLLVLQLFSQILPNKVFQCFMSSVSFCKVFTVEVFHFIDLVYFYFVKFLGMEFFSFLSLLINTKTSDLCMPILCPTNFIGSIYQI